MRPKKLISAAFFTALLALTPVWGAPGPDISRNGQPVAFETFWEPDPAFGYERIPVRYLRAEAGTNDIWEVTAPQPAGLWHVLPEKAVDIVEASDGCVRFKLTHPVTQPTHIAVLKGDCRLGYLFLDPPGYLPVPQGAIDVTSLNIKPDTGELLSPAINQELLNLSEKGGGTLYFPPGTYTISTIQMHDSTSLYLEDGAVLQASLDADAYPLDAPELENKNLPRSLRPGHRRRLIFFDHVQNASVLGKGVIDAQGSEWRRRTMPGRRAFLNHIRMVESRNIRLDGIILRDSEFWSTHILLSENVRIDGVKIVNEIPPKGWDRFVKPQSQSVWNNADGINPDSFSKHLHHPHLPAHRRRLRADQKHRQLYGSAAGRSKHHRALLHDDHAGYRDEAWNRNAGRTHGKPPV